MLSQDNAAKAKISSLIVVFFLVTVSGEALLSRYILTLMIEISSLSLRRTDTLICSIPQVGRFPISK